MRKNGKLGSKISRKIQCFTLIPLITGILLCAFVSLLLLFVHYANWVDEIETYLVSKEKQYLANLSQSRAEAFTYYIQGISDKLVILNKVQKDAAITSVQGAAKAVDWYSEFESTGMP